MNPVANTLPFWLEKSYQSASAALPAWLNSAREQHWLMLKKNGLPDRKVEHWKYADISFLANDQYMPAEKVDHVLLKKEILSLRLKQKEAILLVLVDGKFYPELSDVADLPKTTVVCSLSEAITKHTDLLSQYWQNANDKHPFLNANMALFEDGLFLHLPENVEMTSPIHLLSINGSGKAVATHPRHFIHLGENSSLMMLEEYRSIGEEAGVLNSSLTIIAEKLAKFDLYKVQNQNLKTIHIANTEVFQQQDSRVAVINFSLGGRFSRDDLTVNLQSVGAVCQTGGFYKLQENAQYVDHHVEIRHAAAHTASEMVYKGVLDRKSRAVFNGRLHVAAGAQKIVAHQANHNLLLSNRAEVYSKPELEIYADDVKCKHGATTGQLDQDALFYMRSRGITHAEAVNILLKGFSAEVFQMLKHTAIRKHVQMQLDAEVSP